MSQPQIPPLSAFYRQCNKAAFETEIRGVKLTDLYNSYKTVKNGLPDISIENCIASTYKHVNPAVVQSVLSTVKNMASTIKDEMNGTPVNVFMTFGGNTNSADYIAGYIAGMHFIQDRAYLHYQEGKNNVTKEDVNDLRRILAKLDIPTFKIEDPENDQVFKNKASEMSELLLDFVTWSKDNNNDMLMYKAKFPEASNKELLPVSNYDVSNAISAFAMNTLPSVPFTSFFIKQIRTSNPLELSKQLSKDVNFYELFSKEFVELNGPKIVVQSDRCPIMGTYPQPLGQLIYGEIDGPDVTWMGLFTESEELNALCKQANVSIKDVKEFILTATADKYKKALADKNPVAMLIDKQKLFNSVLKMHLEHMNKIAGINY